MREFLLVAIFLGITSLGFARQLSDSSRFENLIKKAENRRDSAEFYYNKAHQFAKTPIQFMKLARLESVRYFELFQYDSARLKLSQLFEQEVDFSNSDHAVEVSKSLILSGLIYEQLGQFEIASDSLIKAIDLLKRFPKEVSELHSAYFNLGMIYKSSNQLTLSEWWLKKSLEVALQEGDQFKQLQSYNSLGLIYNSLYQPELGQEYIELCLSILDNIDIPNENRFKMMTHNNLGITYEALADYDLAIKHYEIASDYLEELDLSPYQRGYFEGTLLNNLSQINYRGGDFERSIDLAKQSIETLEPYFGPQHLYYVPTWRIMGEALQEIGDREKSRKALETALAISHVNGHATEVLNSMNALGGHYSRQNDWRLAKVYYDSALEINSIEVNGSKAFQDYSTLFFTLEGLAKVVASDDNRDMSEVDDLYELLQESLKTIHQYFQNQVIADEIGPAIEHLYEIYTYEYEKTGKSLWLERLWNLSETNKAVKLKNQRKEEYSLTYAVPKELLIREKELKDSINQRIGRIVPGEFDSTLFFLNRTHDDLINRFETEYPRYYDLKTNRTSTSLTELLNKLKPNELFLNFFQGVNSVYLIALSHEGIHLNSAEVKVLDSLITIFNQSTLVYDKEALISSSSLIQKLFGIELMDLKRFEHVYIEPDGIIWKLNFGGLVEKSGDNMLFLGNLLTQSYLYYAQIPVEKTIEGNSVLAFSYNESTSEEVLISNVALRDLDTSIPGTSKEISAISELWEGDYFFAEMANETRFKERSEYYDIVHLAVHGYLNDRFPENSFLQFAGKDSLNDGRLHAYELYNLKLNMQLAVLTACNSGEGKIVSGEGMMSLGRAFAYAGVESLLASRWEVPDISAPFLMRYFYEGLKNGMRKSEALRFAQNQYLERDADNITKSPFYWAGFYVIGNDQPLVDKPRMNYFLLLFMLIPIGIFGLVRFRAKRSASIQVL